MRGFSRETGDCVHSVGGYAAPVRMMMPTRRVDVTVLGGAYGRSNARLGGIPKDKRWTSNRVATMAVTGEAAQVTFDETLSALRDTITGQDALEVLARVAFTMFFRIAGLQRDPNRKGIEVWHVEILQALALSAPRRENGDDPEPDAAGAAQTSIDLLEENGQAYRRTWLRKLTVDAEQNDRQELISLLRDWTMAIRGSRHVHQTEEYARALAAACGGAFRQEHGCNSDALVIMLLGSIATIESRLRTHVDWVRSWMRKKSGIGMIKAFIQPLSAEVAARIEADLLPLRRDRRAVEGTLWSISEGRLVSMLTFTAAELTAPTGVEEPAPLLEIIDTVSLRFGDVLGETLQHLHLDNPVRLKPFIALGDDRYFLCNPHSLGLNLAEPLQEICNRRPSTKARVEAARADWLETKLRSTFTTFLPHADIRRSVKWTDPGDGKGYESDVVVVIDKTVLVFEAKSAKIDGPARRGALNSLKGALRKLVVDPSDQSARFKRILQTAAGQLNLDSDDGDFAIGADAVRDIIRVNVVLDPVGPLSAYWPRLKEAGLIPADADIALR